MSPDERRDTSEARLGKASQALEDSELLLSHASLSGAINRLYYAMFYAAYALVVRDGLDLHKHSAVIAHVHREYVKKGLISHELGRTLLDAFDRREEADYHALNRCNLDAVKDLLEKSSTVRGADKSDS
jgi:uncharacterized protein (UPF0332 family)